MRDLVFWVLLARLGLAAVFFKAGLAKIVTLASFESAVAGYGLLPQRLVSAVSRTLPVAEVCAGVLLAVGVTVRPVASVTGLLLVAFAAAMSLNLVRGRVVDCGCAGYASRPITWPHVVRDLGLAAAAAWMAFESPAAALSWPGRDDVVPAILILVAAAVAGSLAGHGSRAVRGVPR